MTKAYEIRLLIQSACMMMAAKAKSKDLKERAQVQFEINAINAKLGIHALRDVVCWNEQYEQFEPRPFVIWVLCSGEAHTPAMAGRQDHCGLCMPWWGTYPTCPVCGRKLRQGAKFFICGECHLQFLIQVNKLENFLEVSHV